MPYVRGHYRRPRRGRTGSGAEGIGALIVVGLLVVPVVAVVTFIFSVVVATWEFVQQHWVVLALVALAIAAVPLGILATKNRNRRRRAAFLRSAQQVAVEANPSAADLGAIQAVRLSLDPLGPAECTELERLYRTALAEVVADQNVTPDERTRLNSLASVFGLDSATVIRAEMEGFLDAYAHMVSDRALAADEEAKLSNMRCFLKLNESQLAEQLQYVEILRAYRVSHMDQLRRAAEVASSETLAPITSEVSLGRGEVCYHETSCTKQERRVVRSFVVGGVRQTETDLTAVQSGRLYVTAKRLLLVGDGATSIKLDKILDTAVDAETNCLAVVVDGRKSAYLLQVPEPFVTAAFVNRASAG